MTPPRGARARFAAALLALGLLGCPERGPRYASLAEASAAAATAHDAARAALAAGDPAAAADAAERAEAALAQAEALAPPATPPAGGPAAGQGAPPAGPAPEDEALRGARRAARAARLCAVEADERARLAAALGGLKAGAYRLARDAAVQGSLRGLALAARQADQRGLDALPAPARDAALQAAAWAQATTGRGPRPDGSPDWAGIAGDLEAVAAAPPTRDLGVCLAVGFLALGRTGLALLEAEALDPAASTDPVERLALHLLRGLVRSANGYRRLALLEVEAGLAGAGALGADTQGLLRGPDGAPLPLAAEHVLGGMHLLLAVYHLDQKDFPAADVELARALRAWPDSPLADFLAGERLAASGERERAADSLEASARGMGDEAAWVAARVAARARRIRAGEVDADDGLLGDPAFLAQVALYALWRAAERTPEAARARAQVERGRALCRDLLAHVPGLGREAPGDPAPVVTATPPGG